MQSIGVRYKSGVLLDTVDAESLEPFIATQQEMRPGRMSIAIGVQDNKGRFHIVRTKTDMAGLETDGELKGELLIAAPCRRRGYELWKCV